MWTNFHGFNFRGDAFPQKLVPNKNFCVYGTQECVSWPKLSWSCFVFPVRWRRIGSFGSPFLRNCIVLLPSFVDTFIWLQGFCPCHDALPSHPPQVRRIWWCSCCTGILFLSVRPAFSSHLRVWSKWLSCSVCVSSKQVLIPLDKWLLPINIHCRLSLTHASV